MKTATQRTPKDETATLATDSLRFHAKLFRTPMVEAILDGRKSQTRRLVKFPDDFDGRVYLNGTLGLKYGRADDTIGRIFPKYDVGDILWVRESYNTRGHETVYKASPDLFRMTSWYKEIERAFKIVNLEMPEHQNCIKWKPSIHMPKTACRLFLQVTDVRAERLQDISEEDAKAEGLRQVKAANNGGEFGFVVGNDYYQNAKQAFSIIWNSINGPGLYRKNPWVWVITFKRITLTAEQHQQFLSTPKK